MKDFQLLALTISLASSIGAEQSATPKAFIDGTGLGWRLLTQTDFTNVNCDAGTWSWTNGLIKCTGTPIGVIRTTQQITNLELVVEWRHLKPAGNSGVFLWATPESIKSLEEGKGRLPTGVEVQILDHGYTEQYEKQSGKKADWFTTNGDVFPTGTTKLEPFPPVSPGGERSFPRKNLSKGVGEWNHYYVRAINGEVRLWVNGEEVSGGTQIKPAWGY
ncbi:MAG: 3-keto-disaccharide hydrolase, partial [Limisphaerales bacterium]